MDPTSVELLSLKLKLLQLAHSAGAHSYCHQTHATFVVHSLAPYPVIGPTSTETQTGGPGRSGPAYIQLREWMRGRRLLVRETTGEWWRRPLPVKPVTWLITGGARTRTGPPFARASRRAWFGSARVSSIRELLYVNEIFPKSIVRVSLM